MGEYVSTIPAKNKYTKTDSTVAFQANGPVPKHLAIIMDGNGRWAENRRLPRVAGASRRYEHGKEDYEKASQLGIKALTLYAFSTENWKRPMTRLIS